MASLSSLRPPSSSLYPFLALDAFLQQQQQQLSSSGEDTNERSLVQQKELTLRVADSLFGSSLLEGALTTLESCGIAEIQAVTSRRRMFILTKHRQNRQQHAKPEDEPNKYFCLFPQCLPIQAHEANNNSDRRGFLFCSCRAYFERTKSMPSNVTPQSSFLVCKHLLALKLRAAILAPREGQYTKTETATEDEFSQQVVKVLLGDGN